MRESHRKTLDARIAKDKEKFLEILEKNPVIHVALERSGVSKPTFYRWRDTDKEFAEKVEAAMREGKGFISDVAISQLINAIKTNNISAIKFWLQSHHPDYANKLHVTGEIKEEFVLTPELEERVRRGLETVGLEISSNPSMEFDPEIQAIIDMMIQDRNFRIAMTRKEPRLFFGTYLGHYITHPFSYFHHEMFDITKNPKYKTIVIMGARNSAKSTIMNTNLALWSILGEPQKKMVVILGYTEVSAKKHFYDLRTELENNKLLRSDLGPIQGKDGPWGPTLHLPKYGADIAFASVEQNIRGFKVGPNRPDLFVADDIESDEWVKTLEGRNKVYDWLTKVVLPAGDPDKTRFVMLGTLLHDDSVMMRFKRDILSGARDGTYREYPLLDDFGGALWKGRYPDQAAIDALRRYVGNEKSYAQEYLLRIVPDEGRAVRPEWIFHEDCPAPTEENGFRNTFIGIDPAGSMSDDAAKTAMVIMRLFARGNQIRLYVLPFPVNERFGLPQLLVRAKQLADQYTVGSNRPRIIVEDFGLQEGIADLLKEAHYLAEAVRPPGDKFQRVALTGPRIEERSVCFAHHGNEDLINQLVNFGSETFKDLADAFSMLVLKIMSDKQQYQPIHWPKHSEMDDKKYHSPYEVDSSEDEPSDGMHYDPELEYRPGRYPLDKKF